MMSTRDLSPELAGPVAARRSDASGGHGPAVLAWSLWGVWLLLAGVTSWLVLRGRPGDPMGLAMVGYATVGALVASRQARNAVGWLMLAFALVSTLQAAGATYALPRTAPGFRIVAWLVQLAPSVWLMLVLVFVPLVFPDGRLLSRRWRPVMWLGTVALVSAVLGVAFRPGRMDELRVPVENPFQAHGMVGRVCAALYALAPVFVVASASLAAASVVLRFRRSGGVERQQLKWFAFAGMLMLTTGTFLLASRLLPQDWYARVGDFSYPIFLLTSLLGIPAAIGIAIFRHRLYDIDLVINRTLVYGALSAALLLTYVVSVLILRPLLSRLTGDSALAVAISTLAVAALFRPARRGIQNAVDRRFYRRKYDAARTLDDFAVRLRHELDLDAVGADLRATAEDTMQPAHVSLWLRP